MGPLDDAAAQARSLEETAHRPYPLPERQWTTGPKPGPTRFGPMSTATFGAQYRGTGTPAAAEPGSLEYFLTERYCLYAGAGEMRAEIHHAPWPLQPAEAEVEQRGLAPVELDGEPLLHFASRQDVVIWSLERW